MRYEDVRRPHGFQSAWFRLKLWFRKVPPRNRPMVHDLSHLSDHMRRDIGLPEEVRYTDWRALRANGWR